VHVARATESQNVTYMPSAVCNLVTVKVTVATWQSAGRISPSSPYLLYSTVPSSPVVTACCPALKSIARPPVFYHRHQHTALTISTILLSSYPRYCPPVLLYWLPTLLSSTILPITVFRISTLSLNPAMSEIDFGTWGTHSSNIGYTVVGIGHTVGRREGRRLGNGVRSEERQCRGRV
jgi:hypothetical protein